MTRRIIQLKTLFISILITFLSFSALAEKRVSIEFNSQRILAPLPDGYCDASNELVGLFIMDFLSNQLSTLVGVTTPEPKVIFTRCGFENDLGNAYPWGYIGLERNAPLKMNQKTYNKLVSKLFGNSKIMEKMGKLVNDATISTLSEYGFESVQTNLLGEVGTIWKNENVIVYKATNKFILEGEMLIENVVGASTVLNDVIVHYYITDIENGITSPLENATLFIINSKRLVQLN